MSGELERQTSNDVAISRVKMQQGPGRNRKATICARDSFVMYLLPGVCWYGGITYGIKTWSLLYEDMNTGLWVTSEPPNGRGWAVLGE